MNTGTTTWNDRPKTYDARFIEEIELPPPVFTRVTRSHPHGAALMGMAATRIKAFSDRFGSKGTVDVAWDHFAKQSPAMGLWVEHKKDHYDAIIGHGVAFIDLYSGHYVGWLNQLEMDIISPKPLRDQFLEGLDQWIHDYNALMASQGVTIQHILMSSPRGKETAAWLRHGGFEDYQILCRRTVHATRQPRLPVR